MVLEWVLVFLGWYWDLRRSAEGGSGGLDGSVKKSLSSDIEIESLESNTTSCLLWSADRGAGRPLKSRARELKSFSENCISTTNRSPFLVDGRGVWRPRSAVSELTLPDSSLACAILSCPRERARDRGVRPLRSGLAVQTSFRSRSIFNIVPPHTPSLPPMRVVSSHILCLPS